MLRIRTVSKGMLSALILSVIIALMISFIPNQQIEQYNQALPVFKSRKLELTEYNLVEFISSLPTNLPIKTVIFKHQKLQIDFMVDKKQPSQLENVYQELYQIIKQGFVNSKNIDQIVLRVFVGDINSLYVGTIAQKKDILQNPKMELEKNLDHKAFLDKYFGLTYGNVMKIH